MKLEEAHILLSGAGGSFGSQLLEAWKRRSKGIDAIDLKKESIDGLEGVQAHACDLTDEEQVRELVGTVFDDQKPNVLINLAGNIHSEPLVNLMNKDAPRHSYESWRNTLGANLDSTFLLTSYVAEQMVKKRIKGLIVNVSSVSANGNPGQTAYSAAKAGVEALSKVWSKELAPFGIRSAAVAPGFFDTDSTHEALSEDRVKKLAKSIPSGRLGAAEELQHGLEFIISNDYFNGRVLRLDGGVDV